MEINALLMGLTDNVVTCVRDIATAETVTYRKQGQLYSLTAAEAIPFCHKIALEDIPANGDVIKYNESIGHAPQLIPKGCLAAHHNILSVPRDYDSEFITEEA